MKSFGQPFGKNCAVNEQTADGVVVGRCWHHVGDEDVCLRHGNVKEVMKRYRETGKLTLERNHRGKK